MNNLHINSQVLKPKLSNKYYRRKISCYTQEVYALTKRLILQVWRRPSTVITGIIQPLLWLLLFSALFQNAPIGLLTASEQYGDFVGPGIIVFTAFTCSLNAGLPLIFDREFGFLNRLLIAPLYSRRSIILASSINIILTSSLQVTSVIYICFLMGNQIPNINNMFLVLTTLLLISNSITSFSLILAFILPGHVELLACLIIINLPLLFSSTALAPLIFMPSWLQVIASLNPLSYAIEIVRHAYTYSACEYSSVIMQTVWGSLNILQILTILCILNVVCSFIVFRLISNKFEE